MTADFSLDIIKVRRKWHTILKCFLKKELSTQNNISSKDILQE